MGSFLGYRMFNFKTEAVPSKLNKLFSLQKSKILIEIQNYLELNKENSQNLAFVKKLANIQKSRKIWPIWGKNKSIEGVTETIESIGKDRLKAIITELHIFKKIKERIKMLKRDMEI